jgi:hypothetical protein
VQDIIMRVENFPRRAPRCPPAEFIITGGVMRRQCGR